MNHQLGEFCNHAEKHGDVFITEKDIVEFMACNMFGLSPNEYRRLLKCKRNDIKWVIEQINLNRRKELLENASENNGAPVPPWKECLMVFVNDFINSDDLPSAENENFKRFYGSCPAKDKPLHYDDAANEFIAAWNIAVVRPSTA